MISFFVIFNVQICGSMKDVKERVSDLEAILGSFMVQTEKAIIELKNEMKDFKDEMNGFKDEMKSFKDESLEHRKFITREWGNLANRLGTLAEDIAAPGLAGIMKQFFDVQPDKRLAEMIIRNVKDKEQMREFDAIGINDTYFFLCEIKSNPKQHHVEDFIHLVQSGEIYDYFPEYKALKLVPVFSALTFPENIVKYLSKNNVLAMGMGNTHMELVNPEIVTVYKD